MFARPGITELRDQAAVDILISTGLPTLMRRSPLRALSYALAGQAHGHYGYLDWIARQSNPFTAQGAFLEAWAALVGITRTPATIATGTATLTGTPGATVIAGTGLRRGDGQAYTTLADATIAGGGIAFVAIAALAPGAGGTIEDGTPMTLAATIVGVQSAVTVAHVASGSDAEADASLRTRMLQRYASPPQGGDAQDYIQWALAVPGVTRAWVNPRGAGAGTVVVYTMFDQVQAAHQGFPQGTDGVAAAEARGAAATGDQLTVANAIYPLRPVTALVYSVSPVPYGLSFSIHVTDAVSTPVRAAVEAAIDATLVTLATPLGMEVETGPIVAAIQAVPGMPPFTLVSPAAGTVITLGHLPVRGATTTYV